MSKEVTVIMQPMLFLKYIAPYGFLDEERESHALWYYYLCARKSYEHNVLDPIVYEGEKDWDMDTFRQLFESIANLYGCNPEHMANAWKLIDMQCVALNLPQLPDEEVYRFNQKHWAH